MSGRLIILPKKTWNVWSQENINRVKRDEQKAEEKETALNRAHAEAEGEFFHEQLKARALVRLGIEANVTKSDATPVLFTTDNSSSSSSSSSSAPMNNNNNNNNNISTTTAPSASRRSGSTFDNTFARVLDPPRCRVDVNRFEYQSRELKRKDYSDPMVRNIIIFF